MVLDEQTTLDEIRGLYTQITYHYNMKATTYRNTTTHNSVLYTIDGGLEYFLEVIGPNSFAFFVLVGNHKIITPIFTGDTCVAEVWDTEPIIEMIENEMAAKGFLADE